MKVSDNVLKPILLSHVVTPAPPQPSPPQAHPAVMLSRPALMMARPAFTAALANDGARTESSRATPAVQQEVTLDQPATGVAIHDEVASKIEAFPFRERLEIQTMLATNAPTQPVVTSDATISFDYCVVDVTRPWFHNAFVNNRSWCIPGQGKGALSANDGHGLPTLPVGFIAIKSLSIQALWTPDDVTNLEQSVQFGPFNFDSKVVNGAVGHDGIQIIGWMLQGLPDLPPNAAL